MRRGGKPVPRVLKKLHGTLQPCRRRNEPEAPAGELIPPEQLGRLRFGMDYWQHLTTTAPFGVLKPVDVPLLFRLCCALALAHAAMDHVIAEGQIIVIGQEKDADGNILKPGFRTQNPYLPVVNRQTEIARKLAAELGLPVAARSRLDLPEILPQAGGRQSFRAFIATNPQPRPRTPE